MSAQGIFNCGSFSENRWLALDKHAKSDIIRYSPPGKPYRHSIKHKAHRSFSGRKAGAGYIETA